MSGILLHLRWNGSSSRKPSGDQGCVGCPMLCAPVASCACLVTASLTLSLSLPHSLQWPLHWPIFWLHCRIQEDPDYICFFYSWIPWTLLLLLLLLLLKSLQSCPTLCNPIDGLLPGSHVPGILQARTLEWVAISFSNAYKWKVKVKSLSRVRLLATPWTAAYQAPPSMGFSRQEYWSGVPLPSPFN